MYRLSIVILFFVIVQAALAGKQQLALKEPPSWLYISAGYRLPLANKQVINSGHGANLELGLNLGRIISKNVNAGIYAGWALMDRLWSTSFDRQFVSHYTDALSTEQGFTGEQKKIVHASSELFALEKGRSPLMPGCEMNSFHNYGLYYGLFFKPGAKLAPLIKLYAGTTRTHYQGRGGLATDGDYNIFQLRRPMLGTELMFHYPFKTGLLSRIYLSVFYEHTFLNRSSLYYDDGSRQENIPLSRFTHPRFLKKYNKEQVLGLKLAFCLN